MSWCVINHNTSGKYPATENNESEAAVAASGSGSDGNDNDDDDDDNDDAINTWPCNFRRCVDKKLFL